MNKDMYIDMLEKRVNELEENKKDYDFAIAQMEEAIAQMEEVRQKLADMESRNELVIKAIDKQSDIHWNDAKEYKEKNDENNYNRYVSSMAAYMDCIRFLKDDEYLKEIAEIWGLA